MPIAFSNGLLVVPKGAAIRITDDEIIKDTANRKDSLFRQIQKKKNETLFRQTSKTIDFKLNSLNINNNTPLFPQVPDISQIEQGNHGHCFFAAAILSILSQSPLKITELMVDNGDNTVTVRLYDNNHNPCYYQIDKSEMAPSDITETKFHKGAPWFSILLKAYAIHSQRNQSVVFSRRKHENLAEISSGGVSATVFKALFGVDASYNNTKNYVNTLYESQLHNKTPSETAFRLYQAIKKELDRGCAVAVGTVPSIKIGEKTYDSTEYKVHGLALNHAYSVLDVIQREIDGKTNYYIRIGNPWKSYAAQYDKDSKSLKAFQGKQNHYRFSTTASEMLGEKKEGGFLLGTSGIERNIEDFSGVSEINLADFETYFQHIDFCPHRQISDIVLNQLYLILSHALSLSNQADDAGASGVAEYFLDIITNPNISPIDKLKGIAAINWNSSIMINIRASNPIMDGFYEIMQTLHTEVINNPKVSIASVNSLLRDDVMPHIKNLNKIIKDVLLQSVDTLETMNEAFENLYPFNPDLCELFNKIYSDESLSTHGKMQAISRLLSEDNNYLEIEADIYNQFNKQLDLFNKWLPPPVTSTTMRPN